MRLEGQQEEQDIWSLMLNMLSMRCLLNIQMGKSAGEGNLKFRGQVQNGKQKRNCPTQGNWATSFCAPNSLSLPVNYARPIKKEDWLSPLLILMEYIYIYFFLNVVLKHVHNFLIWFHQEIKSMCPLLDLRQVLVTPCMNWVWQRWCHGNSETEGRKGNTVFAFLSGTFTLGTLPLCYQKGQAHVERNWGLWPNSQADSPRQLASPVSAPSWKQILQPLDELPPLILCGHTPSPLSPVQIADLWQNQNC